MTITVEPLTGSIAAEVTGVDLRKPIEAPAFAALHAAFLAHGVLVFRDQHVTPGEQVAYARRWGEPVVTAMLKGIDGHPEVVQIARIPKETASTEAWHYDGPFTPVPPKITILSAIVVPHGGDTMWCNQYRAYESLTPKMQRMLDGQRACFRGVRLARMYGVPEAEIPAATHPLVRTHPETGRKAIYIGHPDNLQHLEGMTEAESRPLLDFLYRHSTSPDNVYRHMWRIGDVVMWDNRCTMHYAVHDYGQAERVLNRVTLKGEVPA
ncbi:MAG: TauD/TfdA dioxygenase family protein [Burkholderiales bacterium]